jgi:diguanylate cyclase (GGDEF)-like protein
MKKYKSLTFKITSFSTAVILLTSICVALIVYFVISSFFLDLAVQNLKNETRLIANDIENSFIKTNNDLNVLMKTPSMQGIIKSLSNKGADAVDKTDIARLQSRLSAIFTSMIEANKNYTQIRLIGIKDDGKEIVRVNQASGGAYTTEGAALQKKADTEYFKRGVMLSRGSILFSNINYNSERGKVEYPQVPTLRAIMPVYTADQDVFGILVINVNMRRYLRDILLRSVNHYDVIIYDQYNDFFIFNPGLKTMEFLHRDEKIPKELFGDETIKSTNEIVSHLKKDKSLMTVSQPVYSNIHKDQKVFTVAISIPKEIIRSGDASVITTMLLWLVGLCLLSSFIIYVFIKKMMKPLAKMTKTIKGSDNFSTKSLVLPTHLNDEVGLLARAFEQKTKLLKKLALFDSLTGLPNRKSFIDHLDESIQYCKRQNSLLAIVYLDVNKFKEINDIYGHDSGDDLLIQLSAALTKEVRQSDYCARLGGDEFAVILREIGSEEELMTTLKRYEDSLNKTYVIKGIALNVSLAGGACVYPNDASQPDEMIRYADEAMYLSKKEGKGHFFRYANKK